jgi:hypothetical protein
MPQLPWEISQPNYFRNGINVAGTAVVPGRILRYSTTTEQAYNGYATSPAESFYGVSVEESDAGQARSVQVDGIAVVTSGAAFSIGTKLTTDSTGRAIASVSNAQNIIGVALQESLGADQDVSVELTKSAFGSPGGVFVRSLSIDHEDLTAEATSQAFNIGAAIPAGARLIGWRADLDEAFVKAAQTFAANIGVSGDADKVAASLDIDGALGELTAAVGNKAIGGDQLQLQVTSNGDLDSSTAGEITVEVFFFIPASA